MAKRRISTLYGIASAVALVGVSGMVMAQNEQQAAKPAAAQPKARAVAQGPSAGDFRGSFEVTGVEVDVSGANADAARQGGWRLAQRKGWQMLAAKVGGKATNLSDSALDSLVTGIVIENEQIGPTRYVARLGVLFDRARAGAILGVSLAVTRSPPMLLLPVQWSGGTGVALERDTAWKRAWANFRTSESTINYVRARGTGPDSLLLNAAQTGRRGRGWWRAVLGQYSAADVLIAEVQLHRLYPGGPIVAVFTGSHGPDRQRIGEFALRVEKPDALDALLEAGAKRLDKMFQDALAAGRLKSDPLLAYRAPVAAPEEKPEDEGETEATPAPEAAPPAATATYSVQFDTPTAGSLTAGEASVRGVPGVRSASTTSMALGGISVMRVSYDGSIDSLRSALEARGWSVQQGPGVLRIRRPGQSSEN
ncbi:heavy-metal-associated domain-containing protein [Sphingomonas canadensis]|uniref:Heavy-metal-associated domain-containing protein n=1 Tax=Sphingomonas canadensis TaxID=1219257 RepID=A0ABW3HBS5_9SPHN|nr:heavy-metal-associated domain-containing protein [Sphingomonas canadensis]MCW3837961.1 heavy-metal-associated domain-containing protein [Sphingomonas canadensis]